MPTINITNRVNSPAGTGGSPTVQLNGTDSAQLPNISVGNAVSIGSNSKVGKVIFVDTFGTSLRVAPLYENNRMDSSSTPGVLANGEVLTITT